MASNVTALRYSKVRSQRPYMLSCLAPVPRVPHLLTITTADLKPSGYPAVTPPVLCVRTVSMEVAWVPENRMSL